MCSRDWPAVLSKHGSSSGTLHDPEYLLLNCTIYIYIYIPRISTVSIQTKYEKNILEPLKQANFNQETVEILSAPSPFLHAAAARCCALASESLPTPKSVEFAVLRVGTNLQQSPSHP